MMKNSPLILTFFCTAFTWSSSTQAAEDPRKTEGHFQAKNHETYLPDDGLFDFEAYEATMESLDIGDKEAEWGINTLLSPQDKEYDGVRLALRKSLVPQPILNNLVPLNHSVEEDIILQQVLAESIETAKSEQTKRADAEKENVNELHSQVGVLAETIEKVTIKNVEKLTEKVNNLTESVKERQADEQKAWEIYNPLKDPDPQIETLENHEERERRRKIREEERQQARNAWFSLFSVRATVEEALKEQEARLKEQKEELGKLEKELDAMVKQYMVSSENLESLEKKLKDLEGGVDEK